MFTEESQTENCVNSQTDAKKTVLITGATTGIGYELSKLFAADKANLVLVARNTELLTQRQNDLVSQYGVHVKSISLDLAEEGAAQKLYNQVKKEGIFVNTLVNNAGFGLLGAFKDTDLETEMRMIRLNISTLTALTKLFLNDLLDSGGEILNVASTAAFEPGPMMAVYYATKAYVLSFSEALATELKGTPVKVSVLCPGPTQTEFQKTARIRGVKLLKLGIMDAATVARAGYEGLKKGKTLIIPGFLNRLSVWSIRFAPRKLVTSVVEFLHKS